MSALSVSLPWPLDTLAVSDWPDVPSLTVVAHAIVTLFGAFFAMRLAARAFAGPPQDVVGVPTESEYLTSTGAYKIGLYVFVGAATVLFLVLLLLNKEVVAVVKLFDLAIVPQSVLTALSGSAVPYLVVIVFIGAFYLYLLGKEGPTNIVLMLRDVIHIWIAIPATARRVVNEALHALTTPVTYRAQVMSASVAVAATDFDAARDSFERVWAEISYMRWWLKQEQAQGHVELFEDESFDLEKLDADYQLLSPAAALAKQAPAPTPAVVSSSLQSLDRKYARAVACYLIRRYGIDDRLADAARLFGVPMTIPRDQNPLTYIAIYIIAVVLAVWVGVCASSVIYDLMTGSSIEEALSNLDPNTALKWIAYTSANFVMPIAVVLLIRFVWWKFEVTPTSSYLVVYCWTALIAFVVGPFFLAITAKYIFPVPRLQGVALLQLFGYELRWGIGPAIIAVFISYYMDRLTSAALPDPVQTSATIAWRILLSFGIALFTLVLLLIPLASIPADPDNYMWTAGKLRFIAAATTFFVLFSLAMVAQFVLWKRSPP